MIKKRVQLTWCAKYGTGVKQINLSFPQVCLYSSLFLLTLSLVIVLIIGVSTSFFHSYRVTSLQNDNRKLLLELTRNRTQIASLNQHLAQIENLGDNLRTVANLPPLENDIRQVGVGGPINYNGIDFSSDAIGETVQENRLDLDKLERSIQLERSNLAEIAAKLKSNQETMDHFPSIRPVMNGIVTDKFGPRIHPLTHRRQKHNGVDMPALKGTPVLASADGEVVYVKNTFVKNKSYGREIIIDHGYGYQTRYAHLNKITVHKGQKVKRWDPIGEVGDTGGTTGDHLHYEVILNDQVVDPEIYMLN